MTPKKPPFRKSSQAHSVVDMNKLDRFAGAGQQEAPEHKGSDSGAVEKAPKPATLYPWKGPEVREDVIKGMGVPLSEPYLLKLRFIAEHTKWSQRKFCKEKLEEAIDKQVEEIIGELEG
jgi:hypothetical protein